MNNTRNREQKEQDLINAVGEVIEKHGFNGIGVNQVAKQAGCDKVLIYRYFGNIDGLIEAFLKKNDFYSELELPDFGNLKEMGIGDITDFVSQVFINQYKAIRFNRNFKELTKWELVEQNKALKDLADKREKVGYALTLKFKEIIPNKEVDVEALFTLLSSAINYSVLRADMVDVFNGLPFAEEESWKRLEKSLRFLVECVIKEAFNQE